MSDWRIVLEAADPRVSEVFGMDAGGTLEVLSGDADDAVAALEDWAASINAGHFVPDGLDWLNRSPAVVGRRVGRMTFAARVDCFEMETETGYSNGNAWLRARPAWG